MVLEALHSLTFIVGNVIVAAIGADFSAIMAIFFILDGVKAPADAGRARVWLTLKTYTAVGSPGAVSEHCQWMLTSV